MIVFQKKQFDTSTKFDDSENVQRRRIFVNFFSNRGYN